MLTAHQKRREPDYSMPILREAVLGATCIPSKRGEASRVASAILGGKPFAS